MIRAEFFGMNRKNAFKVNGHAGFANSGEDIVCAAVSSAVQLTVNGITEIVKVKALVEVFENEISLKLPEDASDTAYEFIDALYLQMSILEEDYRKYIKVIVTEV